MRTQPMIFGAATMTVLAAALFLTMPGQATAGSDTNTAAAASPSPSPGAANVTLPGLPSGVSEVMKMYKGGIPADIMVSYINNSPLTFYLSADNLISLQQQGVPIQVLNAMILRYGQLQRQTGLAASAPAQVPAQAPAPQYYSYAPDNAAANFDAALQARAAASSAYVAAPSYPVYEPYYYEPYYYDPFYYPWYPVGGSVFFGYYGGGFGHGGFGRGGFGHGGFGGGGHVGGFGGGGHVGGFGGGGHVGGFGGGGHAGGFGGGGRVGGGGGFGGGGRGGGGGHR